MSRIGAIILTLSLLFGCTIVHQTVLHEPCLEHHLDKAEYANTILPMVCMIEGHIDGKKRGGGSGTCIAIKEEDGKRVAYILTAKHVVDKKPPKVMVFKDGKWIEQPPPKLEFFVRFWEYGENNIPIQECIEPLSIVWMAENADAAIVKVINAPSFIHPAKIMRDFYSKDIQIGTPVVRAGCCALLPPLLTFGYVARLNVYCEPLNDFFMWLSMGNGGGDSGSAVFHLESMEIMAISAIGTQGNSHLGGCVSIVDILEELEDSDLAYILEE